MTGMRNRWCVEAWEWRALYSVKILQRDTACACPAFTLDLICNRLLLQSQQVLFFCVSYSYYFQAGLFKMVFQDGFSWFKMVFQHVQVGLKLITQTWHLKSGQNHAKSSLRGQLWPENQAWSPRSPSLSKQFSWAANWSYKLTSWKSLQKPSKISLGDQQTTKPV